MKVRWPGIEAIHWRPEQLGRLPDHYSCLANRPAWNREFPHDAFP
jgi:hypothetical protein